MYLQAMWAVVGALLAVALSVLGGAVLLALAVRKHRRAMEDQIQLLGRQPAAAPAPGEAGLDDALAERGVRALEQLLSCLQGRQQARPTVGDAAAGAPTSASGAPARPSKPADAPEGGAEILRVYQHHLAGRLSEEAFLRRARPKKLLRIDNLQERQAHPGRPPALIETSDEKSASLYAWDVGDRQMLLPSLGLFSRQGPELNARGDRGQEAFFSGLFTVQSGQALRVLAPAWRQGRRVIETGRLEMPKAAGRLRL